jgi:hypothetical protein
MFQAFLTIKNAKNWDIINYINNILEVLINEVFFEELQISRYTARLNSFGCGDRHSGRT